MQSLDRALQLLEHLADAGGSLRLAELEAATGLSVSGPSGRITAGRVGEIAPVLQTAAVRLCEDLQGASASAAVSTASSRT